MPYDPTKPVEGTLCDAVEMRAQLSGLHELIPAGAQVDTTNTGTPGSAAAASVFLSGGTLHFSFDVPQGLTGEVSQSQLSNDLVNCQNAAVNTAMGLSSANSNGVQTLDSPMADPEAEALRQKFNELVNVLRR